MKIKHKKNSNNLFNKRNINPLEIFLAFTNETSNQNSIEIEAIEQTENEEKFIAKGDVIIKKNGAVLLTDYIEYDKNTKLFKSKGNIKFLNKKISLSLLLSNNKKIKILNKKFRNKNKSTDILSFPSSKILKISKQTYLGDIIISFNFMNKPKSQTDKQFKEKIIKTFIHGFLHLLGFDHVKNKDYLKMLKEEEKIFKSVISKIK